MIEKKETEAVSLEEIREEKRRITVKETGKTLEKGLHFPSMQTMITGALSLVSFFERIHKDGYVYGSNHAGNFRFCLETGELVEDADRYLVKSYSSFPSDILKEEDWSGDRLSFNEFLAPELVQALADSQELNFGMETDWYFLSVFLFEYFFHTGSPFEGKMMVNRCFLSPLEKEAYRAEHGRFCMDMGETDNAPVKGIQDKLIRYWKEYPRILRRIFQRAFIDGGSLSNLRPTEVDWKQVLTQMAMDYQECSCGFQGFSFRLQEKENGTLACPKCKKVYYPLTNGMDRILLAEGGKLYACQTGRDPFDKDTVTGLIVENKKKKGLYGIKNISRDVWRGMYPDHTVREVGQGQGIPIWDGMKLRFVRGEDWTLSLKQPIEFYEEREAEVDEQ